MNPTTHPVRPEPFEGLGGEHDRDTNITIGTAYLKLALDDLCGSMPMAAAAYNAGPGRPRTWRNGPVLPHGLAFGVGDHGFTALDVVAVHHQRDDVAHAVAVQAFRRGQAFRAQVGTDAVGASRTSSTPPCSRCSGCSSPL